MKIKTDELEILCHLLIAKLRSLGIDAINLEHDNYWIISGSEWTNFDGTPDPAVGSLIDDWAKLKSVSEKNNVMTFVDFDRMASILHAISEELNPEGEQCI